MIITIEEREFGIDFKYVTKHYKIFWGKSYIHIFVYYTTTLISLQPVVSKKLNPYGVLKSN